MFRAHFCPGNGLELSWSEVTSFWDGMIRDNFGLDLNMEGITRSFHDNIQFNMTILELKYSHKFEKRANEFDILNPWPVTPTISCDLNCHNMFGLSMKRINRRLHTEHPWLFPTQINKPKPLKLNSCDFYTIQSCLPHCCLFI